MALKRHADCLDLSNVSELASHTTFLIHNALWTLWEIDNLQQSLQTNVGDVLQHLQDSLGLEMQLVSESSSQGTQQLKITLGSNRSRRGPSTWFKAIVTYVGDLLETGLGAEAALILKRFKTENNQLLDGYVGSLDKNIQRNILKPANDWGVITEPGYEARHDARVRTFKLADCRECSDVEKFRQRIALQKAIQEGIKIWRDRIPGQLKRFRPVSVHNSDQEKLRNAIIKGENVNLYGPKFSGKSRLCADTIKKVLCEFSAVFIWMDAVGELEIPEGKEECDYHISQEMNERKLVNGLIALNREAICREIQTCKPPSSGVNICNSYIQEFYDSRPADKPLILVIYGVTDRDYICDVLPDNEQSAVQVILISEKPIYTGLPRLRTINLPRLKDDQALAYAKEKMMEFRLNITLDDDYLQRLISDANGSPREIENIIYSIISNFSDSQSCEAFIDEMFPHSNQEETSMTHLRISRE